MAKSGTGTTTKTESTAAAKLSILGHFSALEDPRQAWKVVYPLPEILLLILAATIASAEDFVEIEEWGNERLEFLRTFLPYRDGIPSHDALNDVVNALDPELFKACFTSWVATLRDDDPDIIAIDGKTSRRTHNRAKGREPLHLVSAWAARQRLVLGQQATSEKSNEITAIPLLLARLALKGALVTIDAMGTQVEIARNIIDGGGDYLSGTEGQPPIAARRGRALLCRSQGRGRRGAHDDRRRPRPHRRAPACRLPRCRAGCSRTAVTPTSRASRASPCSAWSRAPSNATARPAIERRYYLCSAKLDAATFARAVRAHWGVENRLHWVLDVVFHDDLNRLRTGHGPENMAIVRHMALNLMRATTAKASLKVRRKKAAWNARYLGCVLRGAA